MAARLERRYYENLEVENPLYAERPSRAQRAYIDPGGIRSCQSGDELNDYIQKYSIGWDVSRISRLTRTIMQLAILRCFT